MIYIFTNWDYANQINDLIKEYYNLPWFIRLDIHVIRYKVQPGSVSWVCICCYFVALSPNPSDEAHPTGALTPTPGAITQVSPILGLPQNHGVPQETAQRGPEMPESVRDGEQRPVVYPV